ncbi:MAG: hypothetical protein LBR57_01720 [Alistipes sp.]|jgi:hypothetical protein|nr:hypothetical protein [Alistipes sp.]
MKKFLLLFAPLLLTVGCAQNIEPVTLDGAPDVTERTRLLDGAIYNEAADSWMLPQKDPFDLINFPGLEATHLALRIYPRNGEEQRQVETSDGVRVAYVPFDQSPLTARELDRLPVRTRTAADTFTEKSPYTVTWDDGPAGPVTHRLPIMYTVWPIDRPLPDDLEYVVDYEIFLPAGPESAENPGAPFMEYMTVSGDVLTYDSTLQANVPMSNLRIVHRLGSLITEAYTDKTGHFTMRVAKLSDPTNPQSVPVSSFAFTYQDRLGRWKIITDNTAPLSIGFEPDFLDVLPAGDRQENEIHRAMDYYYNVQNVFPKPSSLIVEIFAQTISNRASNGYFIPPANITIPNNSTIYAGGGRSARVVGAVLHEIGHFFLRDRKSTKQFFDESFASYSGWYQCEEYYKALGWARFSPRTDISENAQQIWRKTFDNVREYYSPLFVDLTDNYNQFDDYNGPNDNIKDVPATAVWNLALTCNTWAQYRAKLESYIGTYYTDTQFNDWITDFDYYCENHNL